MKVFKKINIIDFIVIIAVIVAAAVIVVAKVKNDSADDLQLLQLKYYAEEIDAGTAQHVNVGGALYDDTAKVELGKITDVMVDESVSFALKSDGTYVRAKKDGYNSILITGEVMGKKTDLGATIGGEKYGVGHTFMLVADDTRIQLRVYDIDVKE